MKNLQQLKIELVANGLSTQAAADKADTKVLSVKAEWDMDDNIIIHSVTVGIFGGGTIYKGVKTDAVMPVMRKDNDYEVTESNMKADLKKMYPDCDIWLRIE